MDFKPYPHIERFGTQEVQGIEEGTTYVFPKIDGTNASLWMGDDWTMRAGSRNKELGYGKEDNHGFKAWAITQKKLIDFLQNSENIRIYGEWLVPHSLKTYRKEAWRDFYVFDVEHNGKFLAYDDYKVILDCYGINYIPPIAIVKNGTLERYNGLLVQNQYLIEDGKGAGEGIVIKRYDFVNQYGRTTWAKIITSEFREAHTKEMGASIMNAKALVEEAIANEFVTKSLVDKEYAKIESAEGWSSKLIPKLLNTVFYEVIKEESWEFLKKHKFPTVNYATLRALVFAQTKRLKPEVF